MTRILPRKTTNLKPNSYKPNKNIYGLPLFLCHTIGKYKKFSSSVTILPKTFVLLEINIHHTSSICHSAISSDWPAVTKCPMHVQYGRSKRGCNSWRTVSCSKSAAGTWPLRKALSLAGVVVKTELICISFQDITGMHPQKSHDTILLPLPKQAWPHRWPDGAGTAFQQTEHHRRPNGLGYVQRNWNQTDQRCKGQPGKASSQQNYLLKIFV